MKDIVIFSGLLMAGMDIKAAGNAACLNSLNFSALIKKESEDVEK